MDSLLAPTHGGRRKRRHRSRVRQFYSDFNSESSSSPSDSDSDHAVASEGNGGSRHYRSREGRSRGRRNRNTEARVFTFEQQQQQDRSLPRAPKQNGHFHYNEELSPRSKSVGPRPLSPWGAHSARRGPELQFPLSPGVTNNQDLKDRAYELIYQKKIKDLRSTADRNWFLLCSSKLLIIISSTNSKGWGKSDNYQKTMETILIFNAYFSLIFFQSSVNTFRKRPSPSGSTRTSARSTAR